MTPSLIRAGFMLGCCAAFTPWSPATAQPAPAAEATPHSRICSARGQVGTSANIEPTWSLTISNEGLPCTHVRQIGKGAVFQVTQPPQHGQITQRSLGAQTAVTYTPVKGYTGADAFTLWMGMGNRSLPYLVNVIP